MTEIPLQALAGGSAPRWPDKTTSNGSPYVEGWYQMQLERGAVMVGVRIWHGWGKQDGRDVEFYVDPVTNTIRHRWAADIERNWGWHAARDNVAVHPWLVWPNCSGDPIDEVEYLRLLGRRFYAIEFDPASPFANPRAKVDFGTVKHNLPDPKGLQK